MTQGFITIFNNMKKRHNDCFVDVNGETKMVPLFDEDPIFGFADANDPLFDEFKKDGIVGPCFKKPTEWLPTAKTVISFFFPFSKAIKLANEKESEMASLQWAYGRIEGQKFINLYIEDVAEYLESLGMYCEMPSLRNDFVAIADANEDLYSSCWSERHVAYVAGLGTFGMSRGLITEKGIAGRFGSIIIDKYIEPTKRNYTDIYEYCIKCGACAKRCPVNAIPPNGLKDHKICQQQVNKSKEIFKPRYGCGLCQTGVPCMSQRPTLVKE